ncbi:hypothetical protein Cgig2_025825 [Carnegiea gigantea]|uniref:Uncharacterized protein n=1 Tax=Carnegiea gigantea TaxID=171969 RepID=A0A9Q1JJE5_9CARY|nr:hypothetical protein Cgig2_025825 [Carnegiea gigantea]
MFTHQKSGGRVARVAMHHRRGPFSVPFFLHQPSTHANLHNHQRRIVKTPSQEACAPTCRRLSGASVTWDASLDSVSADLHSGSISSHRKSVDRGAWMFFRGRWWRVGFCIIWVPFLGMMVTGRPPPGGGLGQVELGPPPPWRLRRRETEKPERKRDSSRRERTWVSNKQSERGLSNVKILNIIDKVVAGLEMLRNSLGS